MERFHWNLPGTLPGTLDRGHYILVPILGRPKHSDGASNGLRFALQHAMFQQSVPSAGTYACKAWGLRRLRGPAIQAREQVAQSHVQLWRRLLRVRSGVAGAIVLRELGVLSPGTLWLPGVVRIWNTLVEAPEGSLHRAVAVSDWADAVDCPMQKWAWSLQRTLCDLNYHLPLDCQHMLPLDVHAVLALHAIHEQRSWEGPELNQRTCVSARARHCKHLRWFASCHRGQCLFSGCVRLVNR